MIRKTIRISEDLNAQLIELPNQSLFIRKAIEKAFHKRKWEVTLECLTKNGNYVATSYIIFTSHELNDELRHQIEDYLEVLNKLEIRKDCIWVFHRINEKEGS